MWTIFKTDEDGIPSSCTSTRRRNDEIVGGGVGGGVAVHVQYNVH